MMTSGQIAGMMSQQNQYFAGAAQYSQQLSAQMPPAYSGAIGGASPPGGFSYAGGTPYGTSNRVGGGIMSAIGGAAQFGVGAAGIAAGFGMMGKTAGAMLDPFVGAGAGWKAGGAMARGMGMASMVGGKMRYGLGGNMMRLGMGALGAAPAMAVLGGASHMIGSAMAGGREQANVDRVLGQHQFMNQSAPGGRGFNRQQSKGIGDMMRGMQELPEMMTSMSELTSIMDKMGQMGVMQGTQNVAEFKTKFKQNIKLLKDMSKVMATSMEEALPMFGEIKRSGIYETGDILKNAMNRKVVGGISGTNQQQVNQVSQYGADVNWSQGGTRAQGSKHGLRVLGQLGAAKEMGLITDDQVMEHTGGVGGAEGLKMMSQELVGLSHKLASGNVGMVTSLALGKMEDGRFTGEMDEEKMERYRAGEYSFSDIRRMAGKRRGRKAAMSYYSHDKAMTANLASGMGAEGSTEMLRGMLGDRGFKDPSALNLLAQRFGMSQRQTKLLPLMEKMPEIEREMRQQGRTETRRLAQDAFMKDNHSWEAVKAKAKKRISNITTEPFKRFGSDLRNSINQSVDDFVDDLTGRYEVEVTKSMSTLMQGAMTSEGSSRNRLLSMMDRSGFMGGRGKGANFTGGKAAGFMNWASGTETSGEAAVGMMDLMGGSSYKYEHSNKQTLQNMGVQVLSAEHNTFSPNKYTGYKAEDLASTSKRILEMASGGDLERRRNINTVMMMNPGMSKDIIRRTMRISNLGSNLSGKELLDAYGGVSRGTDFDALSDKMGAEGIDDVDPLDLVSAVLSNQGVSRKGFDEALTTSGSNLGGFLGMGNDKVRGERIKEIKGILGKKYGKEKGFEEIQAFSAKYGGTETGDILFGRGKGAPGLLAGFNDVDIVVPQVPKRKRGFFSGDSFSSSSGYADSGVTAKTSREKVLQLASDVDTGRLRGDKMYAVKAADKIFYEANKGIIDQQAANIGVANAIQKRADGGRFSDDESKALKLKLGGKDINEMPFEVAQDIVDVKKSIDAGGWSTDDRSLMTELNKSQWASGISAMFADVSAEGSKIVNSVIATRGAASKLGIEFSDELQAVLGDLDTQGRRMEATNKRQGAADFLRGGIDVDGDGIIGGKEGGGGLQYGAIAADAAKLTRKDRDVAEASDPRLAIASRRRLAVQKRFWAKGGKNRDVALKDMFDMNAFSKLDPTTQEGIERIAGDGVIQKSEREDIVQLLGNDSTSKDVLSVVGVKTKNAQVSSADIAQSMSAFAASTTQLATIVGHLANGRDPSKPKGNWVEPQ